MKDLVPQLDQAELLPLASQNLYALRSAAGIAIMTLKNGDAELTAFVPGAFSFVQSLNFS